jgi:hypothetical protein
MIFDFSTNSFIQTNFPQLDSRIKLIQVVNYQGQIYAIVEGQDPFPN